MEELDDLREVMLTITSLYGTPGNSQKRNLWNAYYKLKKAIAVIHCCNELPSNSLADWANKNHWTYNFCDNKWWQLQESQNYIKLSTEELAKLCLKETT